MQNSFKVTLHQEWVVGGWIVLLQNQEMAGSRIGRAGGPGPALALPTRGPGLRPWLPRASAGPAATLPAAALVALSCARPRQGRHQPSPSIRAAACAPGPFGISWRSADPGYDHRLEPDRPTSKYVGAQPVLGHAQPARHICIAELRSGPEGLELPLSGLFLKGLLFQCLRAEVIGNM